MKIKFKKSVFVRVALSLCAVLAVVVAPVGVLAFLDPGSDGLVRNVQDIRFNPSADTTNKYKAVFVAPDTVNGIPGGIRFLEDPANTVAGFRFGLGAGWLRFDTTSGTFQWSSNGTTWNNFGGGQDADADPTNELQDVLSGQGLRRDIVTNSLGLEACAPSEILQRNDNGTPSDATDDIWTCAGGAGLGSKWTDITGGIVYPSGNVGIGAALTSLLYPLTVEGTIAAGGFLTMGTVDAGSIIARGGNITAQSAFSSNWKYEPAGFVAGHSAPRCNIVGTGGKLGCDNSDSAPDCGGLIYDIGTDPGTSPVTCYDWYVTAGGQNEQRAYNRVAAATTGGWVSGTSGYNDSIAIGGDSSGDDVEVRIGAPSNRNVVSFTNQNTGGLANIKAGAITLATGAGGGKVLVSDATGNASWQDVAPPPPAAGTSLWEGPTITGNIYYRNGDVGIRTASPAGPLHVRSAVLPTGGPLACPSSTFFEDQNGNGIKSNEKECFADALAVTSTGNVGIGTKTPRKTLDVLGDALFSGVVGVGTEIADLVSGFKIIAKGDLLTLTNTGASLIGGKLSVGPATGPTSVGFGADLRVKGILNTFVANAELSFFSPNIGGIRISNQTVKDHFFAGDSIRFERADGVTQVFDSEVLAICKNSSCPNYTEPGINIAMQDGYMIVSGGSALSGGVQYKIYSDSPLVEIQNGTGTNKFVINKSGNVGIGTGTEDPKSKLTVNGDIEVTGSRFRVTSEGNVGIGTITPQAKLDVNGSLAVSNGAARIENGNLAIGNVFASGSAHAHAFIYNSDRNLKENIERLSLSLKKIKQLEGVRFSWKKNGEKSIGLIAQDVERVFPEIVYTAEETGLKSVDYGKLVAPLIEAIKEQQAEIEELRGAIQRLQEKEQ